MDAQIRSRDPRRFHHLMEQFPQYQVKDSYNVQSLDDLWPLPSQIHTGQHMSFERSPPMPFLHTTGGSSEASYSKPHSQAVDDETKSETGSIDSRFCDIEDCNDKCGDDCEEECDDTCSVVKCNGDCNPNEHVDNCEDCLRYNETTCENKDCMINDYGGCKPCNEICTGMELTDCVSSHGPVCYSPNCDIPPPEQCSFSSCFPTEVHSQSGLLEGRTADMVTINHDFSLDYRFPSNYQFSVQSSIEDQYSIDGRPRKRRRAETPLTVQTQNHPPSRASNMIEQDNPSNSHLASPVMHNQYSYLCQWGDSCQMGFMDYYALDDHVMEAHIRSQSGFSCQWAACREAEKDLTQLVDHVRSSHTSNSCQDDEHICLWQGCNTTLSTSEELGHHLTDVHLQSPIGGLLCEWEACGIQTDGPDGLTTHLHRDHFVPALPEHSGSSSFNSTSLSSPTEQDLLCQWCETEGGEICGKRFTTADALQLHAKDYHISKLKKKTGYFCLWAGCTRRDKEFSQKGKVERHMQTHTGFKSCRCTHCHKEFSAPQALQQHIRIHTGEKPYKCDVCGKEFAQGSAMTMHKRVHTGERPLKCDFPGCYKRFSESSNLSKHRKTHNPVGQHRCIFPGCDRSFHRVDQMKRHQRTHGPRSMPSPSPAPGSGIAEDLQSHGISPDVPTVFPA